MSTQHEYRQLLELGKSDYQIVEGEPNIIGWEVRSESDTSIGQVDELLFDPESRSVRYLVVDLSESIIDLEKKVMIPIGIAQLHPSDDEVILPNISIEQLSALPAYEHGTVDPATEVHIRSIIGSPAAARMEAVSEFDQNEFYTHDHFNKEQFYQRNRSTENLASQEISGTASLNDRVVEEQTINELIENSEAHGHHAADDDAATRHHLDDGTRREDDTLPGTRPPYQ